jgi:hypothetical protein
MSQNRKEPKKVHPVRKRSCAVPVEVVRDRSFTIALRRNEDQNPPELGGKGTTQAAVLTFKADV